ncbi:hypothetical protein RHMOL_Rhmol06G0262100 [Rhododendron molle]|uniref:Uncharacterized protein n=1 Tax=Rhododendron molle TaxID=49168 RepID=A0ACC0NGK5_RHOML|nr:hypothetical protein RHMOL_Rhmol06G0262100 [Rhododendron molle]
MAVFVTGSLAKAAEGCGTLSQGTNGTREVLIPDPQSSSIPSDLLTTPPSVTDDHRAPLDVVDEDDDCCGNHQATAAWIYRTEGREEEEDDDDKDSITLENTLVGLTFDAAVFLMVSSIQPRGNSSLLATWSPSWSPSWSMSPPPPPPLSLSSASLPITMARVAIVIGLTFSLIAQMMLRRGHTTAANVCLIWGVLLHWRPRGIGSGMRVIATDLMRPHINGEIAGEMPLSSSAVNDSNSNGLRSIYLWPMVMMIDLRVMCTVLKSRAFNIIYQSSLCKGVYVWRFLAFYGCSYPFNFT